MKKQVQDVRVGDYVRVPGLMVSDAPVLTRRMFTGSDPADIEREPCWWVQLGFDPRFFKDQQEDMTEIRVITYEGGTEIEMVTEWPRQPR